MEGGAGVLRSFMQQRSLKSLFCRAGSGRKSSDGDWAEGSPPSDPIPLLSPIANSVVSRCARILLLLTGDLQQHFENEMPDHIKKPSSYARNLLEYCLYRTLQVVTKHPQYIGDKEFRRLSYDMMLAWETPGSGNEIILSANAQSSNLEIEDEEEGSFFYADSTSMAVQVDCKKTVGREAFARIAPACPAVADTITVLNLFDALTSSSAGQLHFLLYDKYLGSLDKVLKSAKHVSALSFTSSLQLVEGEIILDVDGTMPTQPVLQHIGISAWPGRLTLTNRALYFESLGVGSYDKAVVYDLAGDLKQVIKPELIGPLGARLFDKAVMYKSNSLEEPVYFEFPELKGHSRRDYWLAIIHEVLNVHKFIRKFELGKIQQAEALSKAIIGIFQCRAMKEYFHIIPSHSKTLLLFSLAEKLPKGDEILEVLHDHLELLCMGPKVHDDHETSLDAKSPAGLFPVSLLALTRRGFSLLKKADGIAESGSLFSDFYVGDKSPLEIAVRQSMCYSGQAETARATVEQVKVEGIDTNFAVMKELLFPAIESYRRVHFLATWEDPFKSTVFMVLIFYIVHRGWTRYILPCTFISLGTLMLWRCWRKHHMKEKQLEAFRIMTPPSKNPVEQLLTLQEAISQVETLIQAGNIILLKLRTILFAAVPQTNRVAIILIAMGALFIFVPFKHLVFLIFLEAYTREMPVRKYNSEKFIRRMREWWVCIPAAPVKLIRPKDGKKRK
uniref:Inositol 1,4,5-trisphosphate receptor n=1 Tax=Anthurium amnicola TaxID=1678845 RepID=A0A1D1Y7Q1_9ARAE